MDIKLVNCTSDPERQIELAYLACRNRDPWNPNENHSLDLRIKAMWNSHHFSPFEFADATFYITGVSRACSHQFVRHRIASYAEYSLRHGEPLTWIIPSSVFDHIEKQSIIDSFTNYASLLAKGVPKQDARAVLPLATETRFMVKMNFRSWLHFLNMRYNKQAQEEIRQIAHHVHELLKTKAPNVFSEEYKDLWIYV